MDLQEAYLVMQENCGIEIGDTVKVLRIAKEYEMGWCNSWTDSMNSSVKEEFIVTGNNGKAGLRLDDKCRLEYPFFVLEKIKSAPQKKTIEFNGKEVEVSIESFEKLKEFFTSL